LQLDAPMRGQELATAVACLHAAMRLKVIRQVRAAGGSVVPPERNASDDSFYEASARERALRLLDPGTFRELCGPEDGLASSHLADFGIARPAADDGVVTGIGRAGGRPTFMISQDGRFMGGSVGEAGGAKITGLFALALDFYGKAAAKYGPDDIDHLPAIVFSFETGGVRLQEANAGLLVNAEIMELIQKCRGTVPVIALVGSKIGCFGALGFVAAACDALVMSEKGRLGLTGPKVIEQEMGREEFDASDRTLILRTTGGRHRRVMGDAAMLVQDSFLAFRDALLALLRMPYAELQKYRVIGRADLVERQLALVELAAKVQPGDPLDLEEALQCTA
jgi:malonate decarboxylase beta subunit